MVHPKFLVPNSFTAFSMVLGLGSVAMSAAGAFEIAAWMILWGVLLDKLDGTAARLCRATSQFGVQFDSFADFVVFGIAPAALFYFKLGSMGAAGALLLGCVGLYVVAVATRLARFNISEPPLGRHYFYGIPTTLVGAVLAAGFLTWSKYGGPDAILRAAPLFLFLGGVGMVSSVILPKLGLRGSMPRKVFTVANVLGAYICAPLRLLPEYLFLLALSYLVVGVLWCRLFPPEAPLDIGGERAAT